jgi:hypothetical protein
LAAPTRFSAVILLLRLAPVSHRSRQPVSKRVSNQPLVLTSKHHNHSLKPLQPHLCLCRQHKRCLCEPSTPAQHPRSKHWQMLGSCGCSPAPFCAYLPPHANLLSCYTYVPPEPCRNSQRVGPLVVRNGSDEFAKLSAGTRCYPLCRNGKVSRAL